MLDPGRGKTKTGQLWAYGRDERPWCGQSPPAVVYHYADGRGASHPRTHLAGYGGLLQVDGYGAYKALTRERKSGSESMPVTLVFCWSHLRRRFYEYNLNTSSPIAEEALRRIAAIYHVESGIRGLGPDERLAVRQAKTAPLMEDFRAWADEQLARISGKTKLAEALRYAVNRWDGLTVVLTDGRAGLDTNMIERNIRPVTLVRKNSLFAGSDGGAEHWAILSSLIQTAKLNGIDPFEYLKDVLETLVRGFPRSRLDELLPWEWKARRAGAAKA